jgi:hypothetical protein
LTSFGEDACGHVFATSLRGPVFRIQDGEVSACSLEADTIAPHVRVALRGLRSALAKHRVLVRVRCSEDCRLRVGHMRLQLAAHDQTTVKVALPTATVRRLRARLERGLAAQVRVRVRAVDPVGNARTVSRTRRVKG